MLSSIVDKVASIFTVLSTCVIFFTRLLAAGFSSSIMIALIIQLLFYNGQIQGETGVCFINMNGFVKNNLVTVVKIKQTNPG